MPDLQTLVWMGVASALAVCGINLFLTIAAARKIDSDRRTEIERKKALRRLQG